MASIATGLDYHTLGAKKSTGSKMRSYQDDQSGGTDSGDANQAWDRGYGQDLRVMDGNSFDNALADLRAGRLVHLDVWHAKVGGPCLSGSGAYGHTMAVAPEYSDGKWLVADPWCSPPKWSWVTESKLRSGAEYWGSQVYGAAALEADYPADSSGPRDPRVLLIVARIVKRLMDRWYPGRERDDTPLVFDDEGTLIPDDGGDTGGGAILYTTTKVQTAGGNDVGILWDPMRWADPGVDLYLDTAFTTKVTATEPGGEITTLGPAARVDENGADWNAMAVLVSTGKLATDPAIGNQRAILWAKRSDLPDAALATDQAWDDGAWSYLGNAAARYPCPEVPPPSGDDLAIRQGQYDADAVALLGPRPTG
jgi:hypothetical protein